MSGVDWIPIVSQFKSVVQLIKGDVEGALRTQINFAQKCPGVSQVVSSVQLLAEDAEAQKKCLNTVNRVANRLPLLGHVKGVVHHFVCDHEGGNQALNSATITMMFLAATPFGTIYNEFDTVKLVDSCQIDSDYQEIINKIETRLLDEKETNYTIKKRKASLLEKAVRNEEVKTLKKDLFHDEENSFEVAEALDKQQLIHIKMPEHFEYTGAILTNDLYNGLLHSLARHSREWKIVYSGSLRKLINNLPGDILQMMEKIEETKSDCKIKMGIHMYNLIKIVPNLNPEIRRILFKIQMLQHNFIKRNITTDQYLGSGSKIQHKFTAYFKVSHLKKKVMVVGFSENLYSPVDCFDDKRPVRTISTVYFISMGRYKKLEHPLFNRNDENERLLGDAASTITDAGSSVTCSDHSDGVCFDYVSSSRRRYRQRRGLKTKTRLEF